MSFGVGGLNVSSCKAQLGVKKAGATAAVLPISALRVYEESHQEALNQPLTHTLLQQFVSGESLLSLPSLECPSASCMKALSPFHRWNN